MSRKFPIDEGYDAYFYGGSNPYRRGTEEYDEWESGYYDAEQDDYQEDEYRD
jgi:hypothetical protein